MSMPLPVPTAIPVPASSGARLVALDGRELPLRSVTLDSEAAGGLASTVVRQVFANPFDTPLAVTYQLPLPPDGAVVDFAFTLADSRIVGRVEKRADARAAFEQALVEGRTAALLEQDRSSLFHQELGNVPPGAEITCEITVEHLLTWRSGGWEWRFPTVVAPRFLGTSTPDADRVTVDVLDGPAPARCALELHIGDALAGPATSPSHALDAADGRVALGAGAALDRDVVVRWPVSTATVGATVEACRTDAGAFAMITLVPPLSTALSQPVARDLILLLDISGSMGGRPLDQLKAFSRALVKSLGPQDQLEMIAFSSRQTRWQSAPVAMDPRRQAEALRWLEGLSAGGGTYMHEAIIEALSPLRTDAQRQVVLVSDGLIGFETEVIGAIRNRLPAGSRVHAIGVGSGVNRSLTGPCARAGAGLEVVVGLDEPVEAAVADLLARTDAPVVVDLGLRGKVLREVAPMRAPDLFAGAPTRLFLAVDPAGGALEIHGRTAAGAWRQTLQIPATAGGRRVLSTRFARERVEDLELELAAGADTSAVDPRIEALGLKHRIATRLTSWVAETDERTVDPSDPTRRVDVPQRLPYGMSAEGVGLRGAAAPMTYDASHIQVVASLAGAPPMYAGGRARKKSAPIPAAPPPVPKAEAQRLGAAKGVLRRLGEALFGADGAPPPPQSPARPGGAPPEPSPADAPAESVAREEAVEAERLADRDEEMAILPVRTVKATVRMAKDGSWILELSLDAAIDWEPEDEVELELSDGTRATATVLAGTTRSGRIGPGATVRLVLAWRGAKPVRLWVSGLEAEVG